ncbi:MAG TPA: CHASE3 domain-containing protein [Steroidobacteraceae bacterium]|nr:CHASE3 domain-containing protein [Steroidobacteraceae bacterium]
MVLFWAAESGQRQLAEASRRVEQAASRERALADLQDIVSRAESGQRGYILIGDDSYLADYERGVELLPGALRDVRQQFSGAGADVGQDIAEIERLTRAKFQELGETLTLYRNRGRSAAIALIRTDFGQQTMGQLAANIARVQAAETSNMLEASHSWRTNRWENLAIRIAIAAATVFLVLLMARLVRSYARSREQEAEESAEREAMLERIVKRRTQDLSELSTQLQSVAEKERAALSRELHDELGGMLVAARMDVSWLEERLPSSDTDVQAHFQRVHDTLQAGVELKRRVVESLRPTLLDNLGLFAALRWQVADTCGRGGLRYVEHYPAKELTLVPEAAIAIFRIVQESLTNVLKHAQAQNVEILVAIQDQWLLISVKDDGVGLPVDRRRALRSHGLAAMRHRVSGLGGQWRLIRRAERGTEVEVRLPLGRIAIEAGNAA